MRCTYYYILIEECLYFELENISVTLSHQLELFACYLSHTPNMLEIAVIYFLIKFHMYELYY